MTKGIYQYIDLENDIAVYIGKDSNIHNDSRDKIHHSIYKYNAQPFNRVLQNNPDRYKYLKICEYNDLTDDELNYLEIKEIMKHKFLYGEIPKFNFTIGGEGSTGYRKPYEDFKYTVAKAGFQNGEQKYCIYDRNHKPIKTITNKETLDEIVEKLNKGLLTEKEVKKNNLNPSKYTVAKIGFNRGKQSYGIYRNANRIKRSIDKEALDKIVDALNNGSLTEEEVKKSRGVKKILEKI